LYVLEKEQDKKRYDTEFATNIQGKSQDAMLIDLQWRLGKGYQAVRLYDKGHGGLADV
jgi:hypothetical protein